MEKESYLKSNFLHSYFLLSKRYLFFVYERRNVVILRYFHGDRQPKRKNACHIVSFWLRDDREKWAMQFWLVCERNQNRQGEAVLVLFIVSRCGSEHLPVSGATIEPKPSEVAVLAAAFPFSFFSFLSLKEKPSDS